MHLLNTLVVQLALLIIVFVFLAKFLITWMNDWVAYTIWGYPPTLYTNATEIDDLKLAPNTLDSALIVVLFFEVTYLLYNLPLRVLTTPSELVLQLLLKCER